MGIYVSTDILLPDALIAAMWGLQVLVLMQTVDQVT